MGLQPLLVLVLVAACGSAPANPFLDSLDRAELTIGGEELTVVVADRPEQRRQGLMEVEELPRGIEGMLFVFDPADSVFFHMLRTPMPLDIWWFDRDGVLLGWDRMQPCPEDPCVSYPSPGPIRWALETPAGRFDFQPGDVLSGVEG